MSNVLCEVNFSRTISSEVPIKCDETKSKEESPVHENPTFFARAYLSKRVLRLTRSLSLSSATCSFQSRVSSWQTSSPHSEQNHLHRNPLYPLRLPPKNVQSLLPLPPSLPKTTTSKRNQQRKLVLLHPNLQLQWQWQFQQQQ